MKKPKTFRLDEVYWNLLKAVVEKSNGSMSGETTAIQIAIWELAKRELEENQVNEIIKNFYDETNSIHEEKD